MDGRALSFFPHKLAALVSTVLGMLALTDMASAQTVNFGKESIGFPAKEFEYGVAGEGGPGVWEVQRDDKALRGKALTQTTRNPAAYRFLVAIYNPVVVANVQVTTRCRPVSGKVDQACGLIVRAVDEKNYYIARANALENNVRFYRVSNGKRQQLATADSVKVTSDEWHTLSLRAEGNRFSVIFNEKQLYTTLDTTPSPRPAEGRVGFWTKSDSVTRFDHLEIQALP